MSVDPASVCPNRSGSNSLGKKPMQPKVGRRQVDGRSHGGSEHVRALTRLALAPRHRHLYAVVRGVGEFLGWRSQDRVLAMPPCRSPQRAGACAARHQTGCADCLLHQAAALPQMRQQERPCGTRHPEKGRLAARLGLGTRMPEASSSEDSGLRRNFSVASPGSKAMD